MKHIDKIRHQIAETKALVLEHVGLSEDEYGELFFETAIGWLESQVKDEEARLWMASDTSRVFWGFWQVKWMEAEEKFLGCLRYYDGEFCLRANYNGEGVWLCGKGSFKSYFVSFMPQEMAYCDRRGEFVHLAFHKLMKSRTNHLMSI